MGQANAEGTMTQLPYLYCFSGAGATGKTTLVKELLEIAPGTHYHASIVRSYYAANGIADEAAFHKLDMDARARFQIGLLQHYMAELRRCLVWRGNKRESANVVRVVCDRSVFDHAAYMLYGSGELVSLDMWERQIEPIMTQFCQLNPIVFHLPYPTGWPEETATDGFRYRMFAKDFIVDSVIQRLLRERTETRMVEWHSLPTHYSARERARAVAEYIDDEPNKPKVAMLGSLVGSVCGND